jgi:hypothetical protein
MIFLLFIFNFLDYVFTINALARGIGEINPLLQEWFHTIKLSSLGLVVFLYFYPPPRAVLYLLTITYGLVVLYHLTWLTRLG